MLVLLLCLFSVNGYAARDDDGDLDDEMDGVTAEDLAIEDIPVDERIFLTTWAKPPYDPRFFTYTDEQIKEKWDYLMRGLRIPYPSADYIKRISTKYPFVLEGINDFDGDFAALEKRYLPVWRKFFAGDFQGARNDGMELGAIGLVPSMFSQLLYALYLTERQSDKYMLLQDVANRTHAHFDNIEDMESAPEFATMALAVRLGYAYAIGRIAEESPIPIVIARRYIGKIKGNSDLLTEMVPDHPLGHADRKSTRLNSSHVRISYAVFCLKKKSLVIDAEHRDQVVPVEQLGDLTGGGCEQGGLEPERLPEIVAGLPRRDEVGDVRCRRLAL